MQKEASKDALEARQLDPKVKMVPEALSSFRLDIVRGRAKEKCEEKGKEWPTDFDLSLCALKSLDST